MIICSVNHDSSAFHYEGGLVWSCDMSTLSRGGTVPGFGRVWDDACDEGFNLVSMLPGKVTTFAVVLTIREKALEEIGDVRYWELAAVGGYRNPTIDAARIKVWNT